MDEELRRRNAWKKDKTTRKYKTYLRRRYKSMRETHFKRLDKLNKTPPGGFVKNEKIKKDSSDCL